MKEKKEFLLLGTNNFWYAVENTMKDAEAHRKRILADEGDLYGDPESNYCPNKPKNVYIYQVILKK